MAKSANGAGDSHLTCRRCSRTTGSIRVSGAINPRWEHLRAAVQLLFICQSGGGGILFAATPHFLLILQFSSSFSKFWLENVVDKKCHFLLVVATATTATRHFFFPLGLMCIFPEEPNELLVVLLKSLRPQLQMNKPPGYLPTGC